ncbi:MAG: hypothetical protein CMH57_00790 [Myxococcales bacterium]|nr:hypothetical protein [Myxococcales bacterium]
MIVTRQIDTQPWRWEIQGSGKTSYVALEGDEIVVGDQWGDKERTYRCDLESFVDGSFHAVILDTFDKKVLSTLLKQARERLDQDRKRPPRTSRLPWEPGGASAGRAEALFQRPAPLMERSEPLLGRSEPLFQRPEQLMTRSEALFQRSESMLQRSESMLQRPESMLQRPAPTFQSDVKRLPWEPGGSLGPKPVQMIEVEQGARLPWEPAAATAAPAATKKTATAKKTASAPQATAAAAPDASLDPNSVYITGFDKADLTLIFALKSITGREAKALKEELRALPFRVKNGLGARQARQIQERLDGLGALTLVT